MDDQRWNLKLDGALLTRAVKVVVVGCGGTGSHLVSFLATLHQSMLDLGHPGGARVTVIDADTVTASNPGRSRFFHADVGAPKAQVLVNRVNLCLGLEFRALTVELGQDAEDLQELREADIVIGCVDTRAGRRAIYSALKKVAVLGGRRLYLDAGNGETDGQVVIGHVGELRGRVSVPCVMDLYPEFLDPALDPKEDGPSCSRAEALTRQGAFVNATAAVLAVNMLSTLFRRGQLEYSACFFNTETGSVSTLPCGPESWSRFGITVPEQAEDKVVAPKRRKKTAQAA